MTNINQCISPEHANFEEIIESYAKIGETALDSQDALEKVVKLNNELADQFGISELQASTFSARILDYQPNQSGSLSRIFEDLKKEFYEVVTSPQTRQPVNDVSLTGIPGLDRLRQLGAGVEVFLASRQAWKRNEVGSRETFTQHFETSTWKRNVAGESRQFPNIPKAAAWERNVAGEFTRRLRTIESADFKKKIGELMAKHPELFQEIVKDRPISDILIAD